VLKPGPRVWLEVRDEGEGMAPSVRARMFEPYYSTRPGHSGLGLAAVMGIVRGHGGAIEVTSNEGLGTTVRIWFPQASDESAPAGVGRVPAEGRRILVVDDEAGVRSVARRCLRRGGYEVIEARDGLEALDVFEEHENIDLVLLDLTMPRLDGMKTLSRLRARQPDLRVVLSSGFSEHEVTEQLGLLQQQALFLPKPWTRSASREPSWPAWWPRPGRWVCRASGRPRSGRRRRSRPPRGAPAPRPAGRSGST
jgi:two-component system cell cycle sensor histidine kinase/response regulator CckA